MERTTTQERHLTATIAVSDLPTDMHDHQLHTELIEADSEEELLTDINKYFELQEDTGYCTGRTPLGSLKEADGLDIWDEDGTRHYLVDIWPAKEGGRRPVWIAAVSWALGDAVPYTRILTAESRETLTGKVNAYLREEEKYGKIPELPLRGLKDGMHLNFGNGIGTAWYSLAVTTAAGGHDGSTAEKGQQKEESGRTVWTAAISFTTEDDPMPHTDIITAASGGKLLEEVNAYLEDAGEDLLPGLRLERADEFMLLEYTNEEGTIMCTITIKKSTI